MTLRTATQVLRESGLDSLVTVTVPLSNELMVEGPGSFASYFRGWCSFCFIRVPASDIQQIELEDAVYEKIDMDVWFPSATFWIANVHLEDVKTFAIMQEDMFAIAPGNPDELIVLEITL